MPSALAERHLLETIAALSDLKLQLLGTRALSERLKLITDGVVRVFGADFARIWMIKKADLCERGCCHAAVTEGPDVCRDRSHCLHLLASSGRYTCLDGDHRRVPLGCYKIGRVASGEIRQFITNDVANNPEVHDRDWAASLGLVACAGYRLVSADGTPIGVLAFFRRSPVLPSEEELLQDVATTASHVLLTGLGELALRESEERYRQLVDSLPVAVAVHVNGKIVFANPEAVRTLHAPSRDVLIGQPILDFVQPEYRAMVRQRVADAYERKVEAPLASERFVRLDGEAFDVEVLVRPVTFEDQPAGQVVFWDISERKRAEDALRESEERYRLLLEGLPDGVIVGCDGEIVFANRAAQDLLAVDNVEQFVGRSPAELVHPEDRATAVARARRVIELGEPTALATERLLRTDGTAITVETVGLPIRHRGRPAVQLVFRDITDRRRLEEQLQQSEKLTALGQLAGGVAHDFNNQLAGILGYAELLRERLPEDDALRRYCDRIVTGAQRSAKLTQQLLAFARKGKYQTATVDLRDIVEEVLAILVHSIDKRIVIQRSQSPAPLHVVGDPAQIQSALLNLAINARDAMPDGGQLEFATEIATLEWALQQDGDSELPPGRYACVRISDTGVGMDSDTLRRACEPFFTTKALGRGTGLGLSAAYGIVRNHSGALRLSSTLGHGTTAEVLLPLATPAQSAVDDPARAAGVSPLRVLLVDDEDLARSCAADMLKELGHAVTECRDGKEAVDVFTASPASFDLVIMDMIMPIMSGGDALVCIRSVSPQTRAILCSGYSVDVEAQRLLGQGFLALLQKPFATSELAEAIARALATQS